MHVISRFYYTNKKGGVFARSQEDAQRVSILARLLAALVVPAVKRGLQGARQDAARHIAAVEILKGEVDPADIDQVQGIFGGKGGLFVGASLDHVHLHP